MFWPQLSYYKTLPTNTPDIFLVETVSGHTQFTVNVHAHTCTCKRWDDYKIPCVHACRVICDSGKAVQGFVSGPFLTQNMILAYSGMFLPVMKQNLVPREGRLAPVFVVQAGRPKKRRIPSKGSREAVVRASHGKPKKTRSPAVCSSCGTTGHHYAPTCRGVKQSCGENQLWYNCWNGCLPISFCNPIRKELQAVKKCI